MYISSLISFTVLEAAVNANSIVVLDEAFDAPHALLANDLSGSAVIMQRMELSRYHYKEALMNAQQNTDAIFALRDVHSSHVGSLVASMRELGFDYCTGIITVTWSAERDPTDSLMEHSVAQKGCQEFVKP